MWYQCRSIMRKVRTHTSILNNPNLTKEEKKKGKKLMNKNRSASIDSQKTYILFIKKSLSRQEANSIFV